VLARRWREPDAPRLICYVGPALTLSDFCLSRRSLAKAGKFTHQTFDKCCCVSKWGEAKHCRCHSQRAQLTSLGM